MLTGEDKYVIRIPAFNFAYESIVVCFTRPVYYSIVDDMIVRTCLKTDNGGREPETQ